jgi:predicted DNA binding CopG/RHH family protein
MANDETAFDAPVGASPTPTDLSGLGFDNRTATRFEMIRKDKSISLRMPEPLLDEVKVVARAGDMPYQRFIRLAIVRALQAVR